MDAIGGAIHHIENIHKYARPEDVPEHTMFVITTDGMTYASRRYDSKIVKKMIQTKKKAGWEFLFLAANIDAVETAGRFGIEADRSVNYHADAKGTRVVFEAVAESVCRVRTGKPLSAEWSRDISDDFEGRKKETRKEQGRDTVE